VLRLHIMERGVEFLGDRYAGKYIVSMGESKNEEISAFSDHGGFTEQRDRMPDLRLVPPACSTTMPTDGNVFQPSVDCQCM
jgi:hypothetical protein